MTLDDNKRFMTISEIASMMIEQIRLMSPKEKAELRVSLRKDFGFAPMPEPDLWVN